MIQMKKTLLGLKSMMVIATACSVMSCIKTDGSWTDPTSGEDSTTGTTTGDGSTSATTKIDSTYTAGTTEGSTETGYDEDDLVETSFSLASTVKIVYGSTMTVTNPLDGNGVTVTTDGNNVVINATVAGVAYEVSGSTTSGSLKIYSDKKFELNLNGASITSTDRPAINIQSKKTAFVVLAASSTNSLADPASYTAVTDGEDAKGAFFSEGQLVFSGTGALTVKGNYKHGIVSDDYIRVRTGTLSITSTVKDAIHTNEGFIMDNGTLNLTAADDGVQVDAGFAIVNDGTMTINSTGKGITADNEDEDPDVTPYVVINGGNITVTGKDEGIESKGDLTINGGNIVCNTSDDGINASDDIYINGGRIFAYATDNDAIDANGLLTVTGGLIVAAGARQPEASFDCDARTFKITGGMMVGVAGATSGPSASVSTINSVVLGSGSSGQIIHIEDTDGNEVMTFKAPEAFSTLIYASSKLKASTSYKIYTGGSVASGTDFNGLYMSGTYSGGTNAGSFTTSGTVTQVGGSISRG